MTTNKIPGLIYPSVQGNQGGNPRDAAFLAQQQSNESQAALAQAVGGYRKKKRRSYNKHGGADQNNIVVPQFQMQYKPIGADGQDPNSIIKTGAQISTQGAANSAYDKYASQNGGKRKYKKGGNMISWGSINGGASKHKKKSKYNLSKHKKTKKSKKYNNKSRRNK